MRVFWGVIVSGLLLSGCASLTEDECLNGEWDKIGFADAARGETSDRFQQHIKACRQYKVTPRKEIYLQGYDKGLVAYCTLPNGYRVGRNGYGYHGICPAATSESFLAGYERGKSIHEIETSIASARSAQRDVRDQIIDTHKKSNSSDKNRTLDRLNDEVDRLQDEIDRLLEQKTRALVEAERFLQTASPDV